MGKPRARPANSGSEGQSMANKQGVTVLSGAMSLKEYYSFLLTTTEATSSSSRRAKPAEPNLDGLLETFRPPTQANLKFIQEGLRIAKKKDPKATLCSDAQCPYCDLGMLLSISRQRCEQCTKHLKDSSQHNMFLRTFQGVPLRMHFWNAFFCNAICQQRFAQATAVKAPKDFYSSKFQPDMFGPAKQKKSETNPARTALEQGRQWGLRAIEQLMDRTNVIACICICAFFFLCWRVYTVAMLATMHTRQ